MSEAQPVFGPGTLRGIIFDLDGTLYHQASLRRAMATRLLRAHLARPLVGMRTMRVLGAYRGAQEHLREASNADAPVADLADAQLRLACERTRAEPAFVSACVARWMEQEPLDLLADRIQPGLLEFLAACKARGLKLGVLSDYPAEAKLGALGLAGCFDVVVTAQSAEVGVFKPHPRGLRVAVQRLGLSPSTCLYVGDRADVDAPAAAAAGVACCILTDRHAPRASESWVRVASFGHLRRLVLGSAVWAQPVLHPR